MGNIFDLSFRTILRCGKTSLVFLCLGLYMIFPACQTYLQISEEKNVPCQITANVLSDYIMLDDLLEVDGIENISPFISFQTDLVIEDYTLNCEIYGVYSSFLDLHFVNGTVFPDNSTMPFLVLNETAAKYFSKDDFSTISLGTNETISLNLNGNDQKAIVCGIFSDGSEKPIAYMSYSVAKSAFTGINTTELIISLTNKNVCQKVITVLKQNKIYAVYDTNENIRWEMLKKQGLQFALMSVVLISCALVLIHNRYCQEMRDHKSEISALLICGMSKKELLLLFSVRFLLTELLCSLISVVIAIITGTFSLFAFWVCWILACFPFIVVFLQKMIKPSK